MVPSTMTMRSLDFCYRRISLNSNIPLKLILFIPKKCIFFTGYFLDQGPCEQYYLLRVNVLRWPYGKISLSPEFERQQENQKGRSPLATSQAVIGRRLVETHSVSTIHGPCLVHGTVPHPMTAARDLRSLRFGS